MNKAELDAIGDDLFALLNKHHLSGEVALRVFLHALASVLASIDQQDRYHMAHSMRLAVDEIIVEVTST
jgi:hypothetical protein